MKTTKTAIYIVLLILFYSFLSCKSTKNLIFSEPEIDLKISSRTIEVGDSVVLRWDAQKAIYTAIENIADSLPPSGNISIAPDTTFRLRFTAYYKNGESQSKYMKIKTYKPVIDRFEVSDTTTDEKPIAIIWQTSGAKQVRLEGIHDSIPLFRLSGGSFVLINEYLNLDSLPAAGRIYALLDSTARLNLIAEGDYSAAIKNKEVEVDLIETFESVDYIHRWNHAPIYIKMKHVDTLWIEGYNKPLQPIDTIYLQPKDTTNYKLHVIKTNGKEYVHEITINVRNPYIALFRRDKTIMKGESTTLNWLVKGGQNVRIDGIADNLPRNGYINVSPTETTTYKLIINDGVEEISQTVTVSVYSGRKFIQNSMAATEMKKDKRVDFDIIAIDDSDYPEEVRLHVLAVDEDGNFVTGIAQNRQLKEKMLKGLTETINGKTYNVNYSMIEEREQISKPYDISLVLDYSGSMWNIIDSLENAAYKFIKNKHPEDKISVTKFDENISREAPLLPESEQLLDTLKFDGLERYGGSTALYAGTDEGIMALDSTNNNKVLVLFTDGHENASFFHFGTRAISANELAWKARDENVRFFVISYGPGTNMELLKNLSNITGGDYYHLYDTREITKVFKELPRVLRHYYIIRYKPVKIDGEHKITLSYNNLSSGVSRTDIKMQIGEDFDLSEYELSGAINTTYWRDTTTTKRPVGPPQVVALFDFDKSELKPQYIANMKKYVDYLLKNPQAEITIIGHTDMVGSDEYCMKLSKNRAEEIKDFMVKNGVDDNRIKVKGYGKTMPLWIQEDEDWKAAENRRIEVVLYQ